MKTTWGRIFSCLSTTYHVHSLPLDEARKANLAPQPPEPQEKKGLHQRVRRGILEIGGGRNIMAKPTYAYI